MGEAIATVVTVTTFCWVCNEIRKFLFKHDQGNDEVYECEECKTERSWRVR